MFRLSQFCPGLQISFRAKKFTTASDVVVTDCARKDTSLTAARTFSVIILDDRLIHMVDLKTKLHSVVDISAILATGYMELMKT